MIRLQYILIPCRGAKVFSLAWLLACAESFTCRCYSRNVVPWGRGCYSRLFYTSPSENREVNKPTMRMAPTRMIL